MREQLIQYVELLFAGTQDSEEVKQEILQNTLDRYDDLVDQGKVPEAAYRLAISGIGDINEILGTAPAPIPVHSVPDASMEEDTPQKKRMRALAIGLYILCPIPLILMNEMGADIVGLTGTLVLVAIATVMMILNAKKENKKENKEDTRSPLQKSISALLWAIGLAIYISWSFSAGVWHISWVIFPILAALDSFLMVLITQKEQHSSYTFPSAKEQPLRKKLKQLIWVTGICLFLIVSLRTQAWGATWLLIPITAAAEQLAYAILDYKEALDNET
ncbi:MAG: hypothetical protein J6J12_07380 [Oscillospiraceae bacterium]|nr:hypothetical protein [Oscillospiraceae bacterium]